MTGLPTDPEALKKALTEARREKARAKREGEPLDAHKARVAELEEALDAAKTSAAISAAPAEGTGTAVVLRGDDVLGLCAVELPPGIAKVARQAAIDDELTPHLMRLAEEAGVVLAADAHNFTRERPGRDADGRTILDVRGRIEGDTIVPDLGSLKPTQTTKAARSSG